MEVIRITQAHAGRFDDGLANAAAFVAQLVGELDDQDAVFAASPTSITMPIWLNRLSVPPLTHSPTSAEHAQRHRQHDHQRVGELSNCAASTRYTTSSAMPKVSSTAPPDCWYSRDSPFQSSCAYSAARAPPVAPTRLHRPTGNPVPDRH
jgi:hypothetical protein